MEGKKKKIRSGLQYDRFFPPAKGEAITKKKNASLEDTMEFIPRVIYGTLNETRLIAPRLKGPTLEETCANIWFFVYEHIQYNKDEEGFEQVRSPARSWRDRHNGVDCDCMSVFISSILTNLNVPHVLRITKYKQDHFQHVYPVVPSPSGEIIVDCVANDFDYEVPFRQKRDYKIKIMDLQYLNGFEGPADSQLPSLPDGEAGNMGELGFSFKKFFNLQNILNKVNFLNPVTVLLRNGLLAAMKLNMGNVANRLRWSYLTKGEAVKRGIVPSKYDKLVKVRRKLEDIFYGAGGKLKNLKKAMLNGKGNRDRKVVAGLGNLDFGDIDNINASTPLLQLLGPDIYYSENEGVEALHGLGEPVTLTSIGAASGVVATIVAALKKIGDLFKSGQGSGSSNADQNTADKNDSSSQDNSDAGPASNTSTPSGSNYPAPLPSGSNRSTQMDPDISPSRAPRSANSSFPQGSSSQSDDNTPPANQVATPVIPAASSDDSSGSGDASSKPVPKGFWEKNKSWLKPVAISAGGIAVLAIGYHLLKPKPHPNASGPAVSGLPKRKQKGNSKRHSKKKSIALL